MVVITGSAGEARQPWFFGFGLLPTAALRYSNHSPMKSLLQLSFLPQSPDVGLLLLRLTLGLTMFFGHGLPKAQNFSTTAPKFLPVLGSGEFGLGLAVFAEVVCAALLVLGLFTRFAALMLAITMAVAFFVVHKGALSGPSSGELALIYLVGFLTLVFAGAGKFSADKT